MFSKIERKHANVHVIHHDYNKGEKQQEYLLISDLHWDNPKCNRELLAQHLNEAKRRNAKVLVNGDFFCLMQGKGDKRGSKSDIRPEHNNSKYLDSIVETAVEWFKPWIDTLVFVGAGNHERSIVKYQETDVLRRFVDLFNLTYKPKHPIHMGGYGGWIVYKVTRGTRTASLKNHYFHGSGGGGPVTKNMIQHQRNQAMIESADIIWMGHVHELYQGVSTKHMLDRIYNPVLKPLYFVQTATYKEEFNSRKSGWHAERGAPPKPMGGYWMKLIYDYNRLRLKMEPQFTATSQP